MLSKSINFFRMYNIQNLEFECLLDFIQVYIKIISIYNVF